MATYEEHGHAMFKLNDEGERIQLSNFTARIIRETRVVDGANTDTTLTIIGETAGRAQLSSNAAEHSLTITESEEVVKLPEVEVPASQYPGMAWVMSAWGVRAIIFPGNSLKRI